MKKWYLNTDPNRGGWVYEVVDSNDPGRVRYAGKTQVSVKERKAGHWYDAKRVPKRTNSRFVNWLLKRRDTPEVVVFNVEGFYNTIEELNEAERRVIATRRAQGMCDLNIEAGGEGRAGYKWSEETRSKMREIQPRGEDHPNATTTWDTVRAMRRDAQERYTPRKEMAAKYGVTESNMDKILRNIVWIDPDYNPTNRRPVEPQPEWHRGRAEVSEEQVRQMRRERQERWESLESVAKRYGLKKSAVGYILNGKTWPDPNFDPTTIKKRGDK